MSARSSLQLLPLADERARDPSATERVLRAAVANIAESPSAIWIRRTPLDGVLEQLRAADARRAAGAKVPLFGVPFAVKDNIDVAGIPTTVACPAFSRIPETSAPAVERLVEAGAIMVGKTNLDQFATGLVGVRSPYGTCKNPFDERYVSGGSSSGSGLAVALGLVSFALGTDTAGSGRVPAAFNNVVGLKPTRDVISLRGVVPACQSLDCVSVFAASAGDAMMVLDVCAALDPLEPTSRPSTTLRQISWSERPRMGVPRADQLEFFGDAEARRLYDEALARFERLGAARVEIDYAPFRETAALLYDGPFVAERLVAAGALLDANPDAIHPVVRSILEGARRKTALEAFQGLRRLTELRHATLPEWAKMDFLLLPTTPTIYPIAEVELDPIGKNSRLGYYTHFCNLLDLAAVAVPAGFRKDGLPAGVSVIGIAGADRALCEWAARFHASFDAKVGATDEAVVHAKVPSSARSDELLVAVAGAHLSGQPLNHQLTSRGARLVRACRSARGYRLYALRTDPPKPGLVFDPRFEGHGIELEVWALDAAAFGSFVDEVPAPLAIGTVTLEDDTRVKGFVCEPAALDGALEITAHGGWLAYRATLR